LIYQRQQVESMNHEMEELKFSELVKTTNKTSEPVWMSKVSTHVASSTGQLPRYSSELTWQAFSGVGYAPTTAVRSTTLQLLSNRQKKVRGEA
jgi:hypothetical protein